MDNDPTAAWPPMPEVRTDAGRSFRIDALEARLRTTAEALRTFIDSKRETGWVISAGENAGPALNNALPNARAIYAQLDREGLA